MDKRVSYESVSAAAEKIVGSGERPTIERVRGILGGGSYGDIGPIFAKWKSGQIKALAVEASIPTEVQQAFIGWARKSEAQRSAELHAELADTANELSLVRGELVDSELANEEKAQAIIDLKESESSLTTQLEIMTSACEKATSDARQEREAAEHARQALAETNIRLESLPKLEAELAEMKSEIKAVNKELALANTAAARDTQKLEAANASITDLKTRVAEASKAAADGVATADKLRGVADALQERAIKAEAMATALVKAEEKAEKDIERLRAELAQLKADNKPATKAKD